MQKGSFATIIQRFKERERGKERKEKRQTIFSINVRKTLKTHTNGGRRKIGKHCNLTSQTEKEKTSPVTRAKKEKLSFNRAKIV